MKILTVGMSPFLLNRSGIMNSRIIQNLKNFGHEVSSLVFNHDPLWHSPDENNRYWYEDEKKGKICELFPFVYKAEKSSPVAYEVIRMVQPDVVITIGDYNELDFLYAVKILDIDKFKWISVMTVDALPIAESRYEAFKYIDHIFATTKEARQEICKIVPEDRVTYSPYAPDFEVMDETPVFGANLRIMTCSKNHYLNNWGAIVKGVSAAQKIDPTIEFYAHTNIFDHGFYDLKEISRKNNLNISFPSEFVGLNDGYSIDRLKELYSKSDIILDLSMSSATGLSVLEGMACGCIPIVSNIGALGEIVSNIGDNKLFLDGNPILTNLGEETIAVSDKAVTESIVLINNLKKKDLGCFMRIKNICKGVSELYSIKDFMNLLKEEVEKKYNSKKEIILEGF